MKHPKKSQKFLPTQKIIIISIIICFALVISFLIFRLINRPENYIKNTISSLAAEYYENHIYPDFSQLDNFKNNPEKMMEKYEKYGFSSISLSQLLLYDNKKNSKYADILKKYCNENETTIQFYPKSPYGKTDYSIIYTYSCEF